MSGSPDFKDRVKSAVRAVPVEPRLEQQIRERVSKGQPAHSKAVWLLAVAAVALAGVLFIVPYQQGHFRLTPGSRESYIASVSDRVSAMMRSALGDHINCAVFRKYPDHPPPLDQIENTLPAAYHGLMPIVSSRVPAEYTLMSAHQCAYHGRKFIHLTWKNDQHLLSLLITPKKPGEVFNPDQTPPALQDSGIAIYRDGVQRFQIAAFESGNDLVYFISDLPEQQNSALMLALAPQIRNTLEPREW